MSKPDKISAKAKKGARYYKRGVLQSTGWKSRDKRFVVDWGNSRQRQRRQAKTEKAKRQRRQKNKLVYSKMFVSYNDRQAVTVQRIS